MIHGPILHQFTRIVKKLPPPLRRPVVALGGIVLFAWSHLVAIGAAMKNR